MIDVVFPCRAGQHLFANFLDGGELHVFLFELVLQEFHAVRKGFFTITQHDDVAEHVFYAAQIVPADRPDCAALFDPQRPANDLRNIEIGRFHRLWQQPRQAPRFRLGFHRIAAVFALFFQSEQAELFRMKPELQFFPLVMEIDDVTVLRAAGLHAAQAAPDHLHEQHVAVRLARQEHGMHVRHRRTRLERPPEKTLSRAAPHASC